jgi:hypothetical protein
MIKICLPLIGISLLLLSPPGLSKSADDFFSAGVQASRVGNHTLALQHFKSAEKAGLNSPVLFFNLGVTFYQLGRLTEAKLAFQQTTRSKKMAALAYYNLGLIARDQNDKKTASIYFTRAEQSANTEKLKQLSRNARLPSARRHLEKSGGKFLWVETSFGYDNNALLLPSEQTSASDMEDIFAGLILYGRYPLNGDQDSGLHLDGFVSHSRYADINDANFDIVGFGGHYTHESKQWQQEIGITPMKSILDGDTLENITRLDYSAATTVKSDLRFKIEFKHDRINAASQYFYLDGERQTLVTAFSDTRRAWALIHTLENNDRADFRATDEFRSYSPLRQKLAGRQIIRLDTAWSLELEGSYQISRYDDKDIRPDGNEKTRNDTRTELTPAIYYTQLNGWRMGAELHHAKNQSNFDEFDYNRTLFTITLDKLFQF